MHKIFTNTLFIGKKVKYLPVCSSTNSLASQSIIDGTSSHGQLILTDFQDLGRGQRGNSWESEKNKNLLLSVILEVPFLDPSECFDLNILTSLALIDVLKEYTGTGLKIKWPNDTYYENKKLGGMLIENYIKKSSIQYSIIGIGLNVNQEVFQTKNAISLFNICNQEIDKRDLLEHILSRIETRFIQLKKYGPKDLIQEYLNWLYWKDEIHVFRSKDGFFNGRILGINKMGKLHMEVEEGEKLFDFKEVEFIK